MKQKLIDYLDSHPTDVNGNTSTRWLNKKDPELWKWIVDQTSFLPVDAKPKQRIWHIINDVYIIPLCPIDKIPVKWWENRYLTYSSRSAKGRSPNHQAKRRKTYKERTGFDSPNSKENIKGYEKFKKTCFDNWGGVFPAKNEELNKQILNTKIERGICRTDEEKSALELYMLEVEEHTKNSWYYCYSRINPDGLERGKEYHLDHIYSRKMGFDNKVPPEIIGHWTNLRLMPGKENNGKGPRSDKTTEQLYEDYHNNMRSI
jgi:hypothetical protein